jgi:hypothetical protein
MDQGQVSRAASGLAENIPSLESFCQPSADVRVQFLSHNARDCSTFRKGSQLSPQIVGISHIAMWERLGDFGRVGNWATEGDRDCGAGPTDVPLWVYSARYHAGGGRLSVASWCRGVGEDSAHLLTTRGAGPCQGLHTRSGNLSRRNSLIKRSWRRAGSSGPRQSSPGHAADTGLWLPCGRQRAPRRRHVEDELVGQIDILHGVQVLAHREYGTKEGLSEAVSCVTVR